ncbi:K(+)-transporting ATPase subunit C [Comamonas jiangduensis]|uniref:Potassium-transporting ATPase KdpC subunit n=1 Tax=Comamonas jiangduensis TaxID=1194168 RepID=A0ABV4IFK2_9BURK
MKSSSSLSLSAPIAVVSDVTSPPSSWGHLLGSCVRAAVVVMLVTGIVYPLLTTVVAQAVFPHAANGSLIERNGQTVGSILIGQQFDGAAYFHSRPSATMGPDPDREGASIAQPYNAGSSGASNQGATHEGLAHTAAERVAQYRTAHGLAADVRVPVDAVTASASGLDPHISVANAELQLPRVAKERGLTPQQVLPLLDQASEQRTLFLLGEPRVNVLQLNLALDTLQAPAAVAKE